jgi:TPR repeat protein
LDEALTWVERAVDAGDIKALEWAAQQLAEADRLDEALTWVERAADAGDAGALRWAAHWLAGAGQLDEAEQLRRYGWEPDRSIAHVWDPPISALVKPGH